MRATIESVALFLEREAGYSLVSLAIIVLGVFLGDATQRAQFARDLVIFGLGVLARSMGARKNPAPPPAAA
jgi:hypothetical protein